MTLSELRALAERDLYSPDSRRSSAGRWAVKALSAIEKKQWREATVALAHAITKRPEAYADGLLVIVRAKGGSASKGVSSPAKVAAARANGRKGGRPRTGRKVRESTRKPGETRGRKPKNKDQEKGGAE